MRRRAALGPLAILALGLLSADALAGDKPTGVVSPLVTNKAIAAGTAKGFEAHLTSKAGEEMALPAPAAAAAAIKSAGAGTGCESDACGEKLAQAAKVRFVLSGRISNEDEIYTVKLSLYDAARKKRADASATCDLCAVNEVNGTIEKALANLKDALGAPVPAAAPVVAPVVAAVTKIKVITVPPEATVMIDGRVLGPSPVEAELAPGARKLLITKEGHKPIERTLEVGPDPITLNEKLEPTSAPAAVSLTPAPAVMPEPAAAPPPATEDGRDFTVVGWSLIAGGALLAGAGTWLVLLDGEVTCDDGRGRRECPTVYNTKGFGIAGLGVGAGLLGAGIATLIVGPTGSAAPSGAATPAAPGVTGASVDAGPEGAWLSLGGVF